jgi:hypothetical protein
LDVATIVLPAVVALAVRNDVTGVTSLKYEKCGLLFAVSVFPHNGILLSPFNLGLWYYLS